MSCSQPMDSGAVDLPDFAAQDAEDQQVVLSFLLKEHPSQLTIPEVSQALYAHPGDFASDDAVERAIRDLVGGGLLQCHGRFVLPTRAALYFSRLEME
jgi:hypothetical protein